MKRTIICALAVIASTAVALSQGPSVVVNFNDVHQRIDGFGAADVFDDTLTDAQADLFFSPTAGIGMSILRMGIDENGNPLSSYSDATKAAARGAVVWAAPWTAPAGWKDNGSTINGGHLLPSSYDAWATRLTAFAGKLQQNAGVPLYGISPQNEPDYTAPYISMLYTPQEMTNFIKVLGPKVAALNPRPKLIMPEVANWGSAWGFTGTLLGDPVAAPYVDVFAAHQYGGVSAPQTTAHPIWETEQSSFEGFDPGIGNGLMVARWMHDAITIGNVSAWHYWWLVGINADNEGLIGYSHNTQITKRLYTFGNFSKFVRPGFMVVGVSGVPGGVSLTAYKNPANGAFVIVAINQNGGPTPMTVTLNGATATTVTPWVTSSTQDLAQQGNLGVSGSTFTATLAANSVTSFVGTSTGTGGGAPAITSAGTTTGTVGTNFTYQITATNAPSSYDASGLPPGLGVNTSTGLISGTPTVAGSSTVTVSATNANGTGSSPLSVTIAPGTAPLLPSITNVTPNTGAVGTPVTITGANFGATQGTSTVMFNGIAATPTAWSQTSISAPVPDTARTGLVVVTVSGQASNGVIFTVPGSTGQPPPAPWVTQDIGGPAVQGSAGYGSGMFSVIGGGVDIWDHSDQFQFVYQPLLGDGSIFALVNSLQNTDPWAKAGVMIRQDLTGGSANVFAAMTPMNGLTFQQRATAGAVTTNTQGPSGSAPYWIRIVRAGNTFTAAYSANGTTWTTMGTFTVSMTSQVYIGLAVTGHNSSTAAVAAISNVTLSGAAPVPPPAPSGLRIQ